MGQPQNYEQSVFRYERIREQRAENHWADQETSFLRTVSVFAFYANVHPDREEWALDTVCDIYKVDRVRVSAAFDELNRDKVVIPYDNAERNRDAILDGIVEIHLRLAALEYFYPAIEGARGRFIERISVEIGTESFPEINRKQRFILANHKNFSYMSGYPLLDQTVVPSDTTQVILTQELYGEAAAD